MERLWAPWRMPYIKSHSDRAKCFLCAGRRARRDDATFILRRGRACFAILNRFPYTNGHLMVAPNRHVSALETLNDEERIELIAMTGDMQRALDRAFAPHGYNLGMNLGRVAGAGLLGHLHLHVVPRWNGDTNFMPVTADTRVMPMSLTGVYRALKQALSPTSLKKRSRP
ncbi:MAG: HIT domain-containing protein [Planctomycetes bacterium]|nr:HIT domain-containing protein [Planctomycetota bacterium]